MAGVLGGECSYNESGVSSHSRNPNENQDEVSRWYFGRKEIEENSPSRLDKIDLKKETYLRKSYSEERVVIEESEDKDEEAAREITNSDFKVEERARKKLKIDG
ncbi:hypothetical protein F2Q70_00034657 [Brassica cretica]|uniref:Uncharacterized protein n=1 Tax=Brassica cretica TaxID=69181 RepID=A0A8S9JVM4_BRACR|nr:hypothetical protein F2Q70_00034657 [Brassica cretica]